MVIYKEASKFCVLMVAFSLLWFVFVSSSLSSGLRFANDSIISSHVIVKLSIITAKRYNVEGFQVWPFSHTWRFLRPHQHLSLFHYWSKLHFLASNLYLHLHGICFANILDSFIPVTMLNTLRIKSSALFVTHTLLSKSFRALQLPTHLSNLTANG